MKPLSYIQLKEAKEMLQYDEQYLQERFEMAQDQEVSDRNQYGIYSKPHRHASADLDYHYLNLQINQIAQAAIEKKLEAKIDLLNEPNVSVVA